MPRNRNQNETLGGKRGPGRPKLYRWSEWFASGSFTLRRGVDYRCTTEAMVSQVRGAASHREKLVKITSSGGRVVVTVVGDVGAENGGSDA